MKALLGLILLALMLSGCATHTDPPPCPAPAGELLVPPPMLARLPDGAMTEQDAIVAWLNDIELYRVQRGRYAKLQGWGFDQCKWPRPADAKGS